jgi:hypothetical protein
MNNWLQVVIARTRLYEGSVGASRDERIQIASDHYIGQMQRFYDGLKNASDEDVARVSKRENVDEHLLLGGMAPHPLIAEEQEGRNAVRAGWDRDEGRRYTLSGSGLNDSIDTMLGAMRGDQGHIDTLKQSIPSAIYGDSEEPTREFHTRVKKSLKEVTNSHIPDILEKHGDIPVLGVTRLPSDKSGVVAMTHQDRAITPLHPDNVQDNRELHQEGGNYTSMTYSDVLRHELGHHIGHSLVRQEFLNGTSQHSDSIWNRVYKGAMGHGSTPLMPPQYARATNKSHMNNNLYLRSFEDIGRGGKPLSGYSLANPQEWFAEAFSVVTHPEYQKIRKGFKSQSNIDALNYVARKIGR